MWKRSSHTQSVSVFRRGVIGSVFSNFNLLFPRFLFPLGARQTFSTFQTPCSHVWDGIFLVAPVYPNRVAPFLYRVDSFLSQLLLFSACGISSSMYFTFELCTLRRACSHVRGSHFTNILLLLLLLFLFQELFCFAFGAGQYMGVGKILRRVSLQLDFNVLSTAQGRLTKELHSTYRRCCRQFASWYSGAVVNE